MAKGFTKKFQIPYYILIYEQDDKINISLEGVKGKLEFSLNKLNVLEPDKKVQNLYLDQINNFIDIIDE